MELSGLFRSSFIESRTFYMYYYNRAPNVSNIDKVNTERVFNYIKETYAASIDGIFQNSKYNKEKRKSIAEMTVILLKGDCMIELGDEYCEILYSREEYDRVYQMINEISRFKKREKKKNFEINLVAKDSYGLSLKAMEIKKTNIDLQLYYEDSFIEVDKIIRQRLNKKADRGIVLLHGLPGTGKTTYLRYLIGKLKKKVMFFSTAMAGSIMNPEFMDLLIDNPNSIIIIEDAENVIMDRKLDNDSCVSNLLNISDGLLGDFLNVQIICTFNQPLSMVDSALLRKGRLIAQYEFGKLGINKAQQLSNHLGFSTIIQKPMTVAEIANQHEKDQPSARVEVIGFRRTTLTEN
jgi:hypothetical protein